MNTSFDAVGRAEWLLDDARALLNMEGVRAWCSERKE
jgi:hypothetical protein